MMMIAGDKNTIEEIRSKKVFVLDLDGVLYLNNTLIKNSDKAVKMIREKGYRIAFLTNNSGKRKSAVCEKLNGLGIRCTLNEVFTSVDSALHCIKTNNYYKDGVFCLGSEGLKEQLGESGIQMASPEKCGCLLVGFKKDLNYSDATQAIVALRRNIPFIICNRDPYFPDVDDTLLPGCGYTVSAIEGCYTRKADVNAGKPDPMILEMLYDVFKTSKDEIVIVGDSWQSDIEMAKQQGIPAVYVGDTDCAEKGVVCTDSLYDFVKKYL
jgi:HAD superfamily hydrolase (TIGR01450 family)